MLPRRWVVLLWSLAIASSALSGAPAAVQVAGGVAEFAFNPDALVSSGLRLDALEQARQPVQGKAGVRYATAGFNARPGDGLDVGVRDGVTVGLGGGRLRFIGGVVFAHAGGIVDLRGFELRADEGAPMGIEVADAAGKVWLTADHAHHEFSKGVPPEFSMRQMDLRLSPQFAATLGLPRLAGQVIGTLAFRAFAPAAAADAIAGGQCDAPWPRPGLVTDIQLSYSNLSGFWDSIYAPRCGLPPLPDGGACTASSTNGKLVLGTDASLRNVGQTAVAWYGHFSGNHPPYGNDQHPVLIWNLYRMDREGRIRQIGASGVKHAFFSINEHCRCKSGNVFWPGCEDIYSSSSNDNGSGNAEQNLGPRAEIIPFKGIWARCGSIWDHDCDGRMDAGSGAQDLYRYRLTVDEAELLPPLSTGARYFFEYWYVVRDDVDIYNTMGHREIRLAKQGANWRVELVDAQAPPHDFFLGPVINRWIDPVASSDTARNAELSTSLGRARVAVKVTALGGGRWRYEYALMNFDYAEVRVDPAHASEPDVKLLDHRGFGRFVVPLPRGVVATSLRFDDADGDAGNDWTAKASGDALSWTAPDPANTLGWGMLHHFEFVANGPPTARRVQMDGAATTAGKAPSYTLDLIGPAAPHRATPRHR
ncbi:hypothetical protein [Dokdonella sp.]|uniref:hypothetical protein n=1 Tax=Dokdonella sp. TaxID=2291710 RepID=UPI0037834F1B